MIYWELIVVCFFLQCTIVISQTDCVCPPSTVILPDGQKGVYESQRAICQFSCITTIHAENMSEVVVFTFTHIPESFMIEIYDGPIVNPRLAMEDCEIENGKQCHSSGNEVTFIFNPSWHEPHNITSISFFSVKMSREATFFLSGGPVPNTGVVVCTNFDRSHEICMVVADFTRNQYVYCLKSCLGNRLNPQTRSQFYKDECPYQALENVQFMPDEKNIVRKEVARYIKKWEVTTLLNGHMAVKCYCVISKDGQCYTNVAGLVPCDESVVGRNITKNVTYYCWLGFNWDPQSVFLEELGSQIPGKIRYWLEELLEVAPNEFDFAKHTPWNKGRPSDATYFVDEITGIVSRNDVTTDEAPIADVLAFFLFDNLLYVPSSPRFTVRLAWHKCTGIFKSEFDDILSMTSLKVDMKYNSLLRQHIVFCSSLEKYISPLHGTVTRDPLEGCYIVMDLRAVPRCPGFFASSDRQAIIHDPFGVLAYYYTSNDYVPNIKVKYADPDPCSYTTLYVSESNGLPSEDVVDPSLLTKVNSKISGLCISPNVFYSPALHNYDIVPLKDSRTEPLNPGNWYILFLQMFDEETKTFYATFEKSRANKIPTKCVGKGKYQFLMELEILRTPVLMICHPQVGAIGFSEALKVRVPPIRPFAICIVEFHQKPSNSEFRYQSRGYAVDFIHTADVVTGFD
ncbi:hypothetical protein FO519_007610 [Halicephalobus sp. NKZ332]|nr:hypothetical protein FO519_007610 [Halicephalobus sp. NKZ332]